jgi:hypothetical protein
MRFRSPRETDLADSGPIEAAAAEAIRVKDWQEERLSRLGYGRRAASKVVRAAWVDGEHTDLVHRIEELIGRGATLDQAARIAAPVGHLDMEPEPELERGDDAGRVDAEAGTQVHTHRRERA